MISITNTMALLRICCNTNLAATVNGLHTSSVTCLNVDWRKKKGLPINANSTGPLVNFPDFSYKDNRPTPYGIRQLKRIKKHQEYVSKIMTLTGEIDYAVERHAKLLKQQEVKRQKILDSKLKQKGKLLITDK
ncbi:mitochondrial ribosomal protein L52 [Nomia melanderi]|uniref:mitochondrial ribosomal protein L52 n=1 Tax=Nomia melanderi TaxID=2448451 RepID=UPI001304403D|nr:39S ribosomal protein L52, mitochondrial [Nomia melanderi]